MTVTSIASVSAASSAARSSSTSAASATPTVNYNEFLQLLVAELQHQDPTSPTDPTQYMSQLASFSSVEQQDSTLDSLLSAQATNIIGQTVTSADGSTASNATPSKPVGDAPAPINRSSVRRCPGWFAGK